MRGKGAEGGGVACEPLVLATVVSVQRSFTAMGSVTAPPTTGSAPIKANMASGSLAPAALNVERHALRVVMCASEPPSTNVAFSGVVTLGGELDHEHADEERTSFSMTMVTSRASGERSVATVPPFLRYWVPILRGK